MRVRLIILAGFMLLALSADASAQQAAPAPASSASVRFEKYYRTELYMGMSIPGGGTVRDEDWERFLTDSVTPLFPEGFTVLGGRGQYREASGAIAREPSHVLVFLYRKSERRTASTKIETIRNEYKKRFSQESVLRVDVGKSVEVSF